MKSFAAKILIALVLILGANSIAGHGFHHDLSAEAPACETWKPARPRELS